MRASLLRRQAVIIAVAGALALTGAPSMATASEDSGSVRKTADLAGSAIVRIDGRVITATSQGDGDYVLTLPKGSAGQWLGERRDRSGILAPRVGTLTARELGSAWTRLGHPRSGSVTGAVTWRSADGRTQVTPARIARPVAGPAGTTLLRVHSTRPLPARLAFGTVNVSMGQQLSARAAATGFPQTQVYTVAPNFVTHAVITAFNGPLDLSIYCDNVHEVQLDNVLTTTARIHYDNVICTSMYINGYFEAEVVPDVDGYAYYSGTVAPMGQAAMKYTSTVAEWMYS